MASLKTMETALTIFRANSSTGRAQELTGDELN